MSNLKRFVSSTPIVFLALIAALCVGSPVAAEQEATSSIGCKAQLTPDTLSVGSNDLLEVSLSQWLGTISAVSADEESGLAITTLDAASPSTVSVEIDATTASVGSWSVTLEGESGTCVGTLHVIESSVEGS